MYSLCLLGLRYLSPKIILEALGFKRSLLRYVMRAYLQPVLMVTLSLAGCINDQVNLGGIGDTTQDELALP